MTNRSNFPTAIDIFTELSDILSSDLINVERYKVLLMKTNRTSTEDTELLTLKTTLKNKIVSAEDFNRLQDCIFNLETFFSENVDTYVEGKQAEVNQTVINANLLIDTKKLEVLEYLETTDVGLLRVDLGLPADLQTNDKSNFVNSINELNSNKASNSHSHLLNNLSNVTIDTATNKELLTWDSVTSKWINRTPVEAGLMTTDFPDSRLTIYVKRASVSSTVNASTYTRFLTDGVKSGRSTSAWNNYRFTAPKYGVYLFNAFLGLANIAQFAACELYYYKNGVRQSQIDKVVAPGVTSLKLHAHLNLELAANDYIEFYVFCGDSTTFTAESAISISLL